MEKLSSTLYSSISNAIEQFAEQLSTELSVNKNTVLEIWNKGVESSIQVNDAKKTAVKKTAGRKKDETSQKCEYVYVKGKNPGSKCGSKVSEESKSGKFCKKHISHEGKDENEESQDVQENKTQKSTVKKPNNTVKKETKKDTGIKKESKKEAKELETDAVKQLQQDVPVYKVKLNKWRNYEHEGTGLLFDRKSEEVYGRQLPDGSTAPLTTDDITTCKRLGVAFRVPERLISENEEKDEIEEEEIIEEEEEVLTDEDDA